MTNWRTAKLALAFAASGALTSCALLQQGSLKQPPDFDNGRIEQGALVIDGVRYHRKVAAPVDGQPGRCKFEVVEKGLGGQVGDEDGGLSEMKRAKWDQ